MPRRLCTANDEQALIGQTIDLRRLGDVLHHDEEGHDPLPVN